LAGEMGRAAVFGCGCGVEDVFGVFWSRRKAASELTWCYDLS
jgi:hypothetical protein